ncbi:putative inositol monophosphatase 3 [Diachasmimorpha longicaudata]|uniref:putative inositol monophosphatase 3 n=1 Tax=Diachasmimorpha longicaudata TaxID=58733 RepID=UPI0030B8FBEB
MTLNIGANLRIHRLGLCITIIFLILLYLYAIRQSSYLASKSSTPFVSLKLLLAGAVKAAEIGGTEVVGVHEKSKLGIESKGKTKEGIDDPVTLADYRSHCAMYNYLSTTFPSVTVISEERSKDCDEVVMPRGTEGSTIFEQVDSGWDVAVDPEHVTVWIDPLDATKEYTESLLEYVTTMVCIAVRGVPVIGIIHKPFMPKQTYWAWTFHGSSKNLQNFSTKKVPRDPILIVSRSHAGKVHNASKTALGDNVRIISAAGAGYKFLEVAVGNATAYVHMTAIKKWDVCAGTAIIKALGGTVSSLSGDTQLDFGTTDSMVLEDGLLATMRSHKWYLDKFNNV